MNEEPTTQPINEDDDQPATKGFVRQELRELESRTDIKFDAILTLIKEEAKETRDHFDAVAENIHKDVGGANRDYLSLISNKQTELERRVEALERAR